MSEEEKGQFQSSNTCWICVKLTDDNDKKFIDHCHITGKFRGPVLWRHNFCELDKSDVKIDVLENIWIRKIYGFFLKQKLSLY